MLIFITLLLGVQIACKKNDNKKDVYKCTVENFKNTYSQNEVSKKLNIEILRNLAGANSADISGAMSKNKPGYIHVRFQMGITHLTDYAIISQDFHALEMAIKSIEYSFKYQLTDGNFKLIIPSDLQGIEITDEDKISGVSFFMASLGLSLLAMDESQWFNNQLSLKQRIIELRPKILLSLKYLQSKTDLLKNYDNEAPNRLLFDAIAFYSLGKLLNDTASSKIGIEFLNLALGKQSENGYFLELNGWDSSYQGVSLSNGFKLLSILDHHSDSWLKLYNSLSCGANWELSRVSSTGEISTEENTRVYSGGETFMGEEKKVAFVSVALAFWNMYLYTEIKKYDDYAAKIVEYYN